MPDEVMGEDRVLSFDEHPALEVQLVCWGGAGLAVYQPFAPGEVEWRTREPQAPRAHGSEIDLRDSPIVLYKSSHPETSAGELSASHLTVSVTPRARGTDGSPLSTSSVCSIGVA